MLILGGGIIDLEMGTVYSTRDGRLDVVELLDGLVQGADRDLVLQTGGSTPNVKKIAADKAGVAVTDCGLPGGGMVGIHAGLSAHSRQ